MDNRLGLGTDMSIKFLKKVDVEVNNVLLKRKIEEWLGNGYDDVNLLGGIIDLVCDLGYKITLTDGNIGDLSFMCFNKNQEILRIKLDKKYYLEKEERRMQIIRDREVFNYICNIDLDYVSLIRINELDYDNNIDCRLIKVRIKNG